MAFFSKEDKKLALETSPEILNNAYLFSEGDLQLIASLGDYNALEDAMKKHRKFEYALLYQQTPEYKKIKAKEGVKRGRV